MSALSNRGVQFQYASGIAPLVSAKEYADLIKTYKATGKFPHILKIAGMAIDDSQNRNRWRIPKEDLDDIAAQLQDKPIMKNHDIDNVDSIIGRVNSAWRNENKVMYEGEISDESLIQKILLGYVKFNSIQIAIPAAFCDNCITHLGRKQEEAGIANLDEACPRCGSYDMLIRGSMVLEQSIVAIPAYEHAEVQPLSFKASLDRALSKRFMPKPAQVAPKVVKKAEIDLRPMLIKAQLAGYEVALAALEIGIRTAKLRLGEEEEELEPMESWIWDYVEDIGNGVYDCKICGQPWRNPTQEQVLQHFADTGHEPKKGILDKIGDVVGFVALDEEEEAGSALKNFPLKPKGKKGEVEGEGDEEPEPKVPKWQEPDEGHAFAQGGPNTTPGKCWFCGKDIDDPVHRIGIDRLTSR